MDIASHYGFYLRIGNSLKAIIDTGSPYHSLYTGNDIKQNYFAYVFGRSSPPVSRVL